MLLVVSGGALLLLLQTVFVQAIRERQRPKYSLAWLMATTVVAGGCVLSGLKWQQSARELETARSKYAVAQKRFLGASDAQKPAHVVTLTKPFYMGKYDVTQEQYQQVIGSNPSQFKDKDNPVEMVSWDEAQIFCQRVTEQSKQTVRLPTEAEWEFGCRAGTTTAYYSGDSEADLDRVAWYDENSKKSTHPVGLKEPNAFGLYDMHGNVWQFCKDNWDITYYRDSPAKNPEGPTDSDIRLVRGGSWNDFQACASDYRYNGDPTYCNYDFGFRVVVPVSTTP
jgi:formylglycine-generating enzyme required for sulfatase activity